MNNNLHGYKLMRVFVRHSNWQLVNLMFWNGVMSWKFVLRNGGAIYRGLSVGPMKYFTDGVLSHSLGRAYSGGSSV